VQCSAFSSDNRILHEGRSRLNNRRPS